MSANHVRGVAPNIAQTSRNHPANIPRTSGNRVVFVGASRARASRKHPANNSSGGMNFDVFGSSLRNGFERDGS